MTYRVFKDKMAGGVMAALSLAAILLVVVMAVELCFKSAPILSHYSLWSLLTESHWKPMKGEFGFLPFIAGTFWCTAVALVLALPVSLLMAIYLTEYARPRLRAYAYPLLDILAGLPSVIYGVWGSLLIVPWISHTFAPLVGRHTSGYTVLAGGIVLAVMILPLLISLFMELFANVSKELREASMALGATRWQTVKHVVLRQSAPGMMAAIVLAVSRTMGETIAVLMVCGNLVIVPNSLLDACYPIPALIANNYGEMLSVPMYESALMLAAFLLFILVVLMNVGSRIILKRVRR
jgi:phosphate transport system permease protein